MIRTAWIATLVIAIALASPGAAALKRSPLPVAVACKYDQDSWNATLSCNVAGNPAHTKVRYCPLDAFAHPQCVDNDQFVCAVATEKIPSCSSG